MKILLLSFFTMIAFACNAQTKAIKYHFRLVYAYTEQFTIDIYADSNNEFSGSILAYAEEYIDTNKERETNRHYEEKFNVDSAAAHRIIDLYRSLRIDQIKEWRGGLDGMYYTIEFIEGNVKSKHKYWSPEAIKTGDGRLMKSFIDQVKAIAFKASRGFSAHIPFECHSIKGEGDIACRVLTKQHKRKYRNDRNVYRKLHPELNKTR